MPLPNVNAYKQVRAKKKSSKVTQGRALPKHGLLSDDEARGKAKSDLVDGYMRNKLLEIQKQENALRKEQGNRYLVHSKNKKGNWQRDNDQMLRGRKTILQPLILGGPVIGRDGNNASMLDVFPIDESCDKKKTFYGPFSKVSQETLRLLKERESAVPKDIVSRSNDGKKRVDLTDCVRISKIIDLNADIRKRVQDIRANILKAGNQIHEDVEIHRNRMMRDTHSERERISKLLKNNQSK